MKKKNFVIIALIVLILTFFASFAFADFSVTLEWDPSPSQIAGTKVYYKAGSSGGAPYDGTGILEGDSPIDVGNVTTVTLSGFSEKEDYYFTVTAYDSFGRESEYSNEVASLRPQPHGNLIMRIIKKIVWTIRHWINI